MLTLLAPKRFCPMVPDAPTNAALTNWPAIMSPESRGAVNGVPLEPQESSRTTTSRGEDVQLPMKAA